MSKLINVASTSLFPLRLQEPMPEEFAEKPGLAPPLRSVVIAGNHHHGEVVTRGVDAEVFDAWMNANEHHEINRNGLLRVVSDEEADALDNPAQIYGFEHGLKLAAEAEPAASEGSVEEDVVRGHLDAPDMNAKGSEPPGGTEDAAGDPGLAHANIANPDAPIAGGETGPEHVVPRDDVEGAGKINTPIVDRRA